MWQNDNGGHAARTEDDQKKDETYFFGIIDILQVERLVMDTSNTSTCSRHTSTRQKQTHLPTHQIHQGIQHEEKTGACIQGTNPQKGPDQNLCSEPGCLRRQILRFHDKAGTTRPAAWETFAADRRCKIEVTACSWCKTLSDSKVFSRFDSELFRLNTGKCNYCLD